VTAQPVATFVTASTESSFLVLSRAKWIFTHSPLVNHPEEHQVSIILQSAAIEQLDALRRQWGMPSRGQAIERLLEIVLNDASKFETEHER